MKRIPPPCPEPEVGPKYWRSLDQLADTPEFRQWLEREFPAGASEMTNAVDRRHFVKIMSASFLLAGLGLTGCRRPEEQLLPFSKMPEGYIHGKASFFATARPTRGTAVPVVAKSYDGRPIKLEGNPEHPLRVRGTDAFTQASILDLYDPDRVMAPSASTTVETQTFLDQLGRRFAAGQGAGLAFVFERSSSPTRDRVMSLLADRMPQALWCVHEPVDFFIHNEAASLIAGQPVVPSWKLDNARRILTLDCDFLGDEEDSFRYIGSFARGRRINTADDEMSRLYSVEPLMTVTGANADHRFRLPGSQVLPFAAKLALEVFKHAIGPVELTGYLERLAADFPADEHTQNWIAACAADLANHRTQTLVLAGHRQPLAVHLIAHLINRALDGFGNTVFFRRAPGSPWGGLAELTAALNGGDVDTVVVLGGNPAYTAPADLNLAEALKKAKSIVRLGYYHDETSALATKLIPQAHFLEAWGDARSGDGTYVTIQPLIEPLFGGFSELEVLARLAGLPRTRPLDLVRDTFSILVSGMNEELWKKTVHDGFLANSAPPTIALKWNFTAIAEVFSDVQPAPVPATDRLEVAFHRSPSVDDGRFNNNGWLQELPDPITKVVWENVIMVSAKTAADLGLRIAQRGAGKSEPVRQAQLKSNDLGVPIETNDIVEIELEGRTITGPAWIQPGLADNVVALELGYGRSKTGRVGTGSGYNAYALRPSRALHYASGARLVPTGRMARVATTQEHGAMEGRPIVREGNVAQFREKPDFAKNMDLEAHAAHIPKDATARDLQGNPLPGQIYRHPYESHPETRSTVHQWGMVIDLSSCVGCNACVVACQSENNIPIVGKDQVNRGREMHWMRIDRYFAGDVADPQVANQPMLCQHCESAPCESVCPVNATVHDEEGLNVMAYNRCIGTRYCSNNCPYKVRRFNYFDFNKRPINHADMPGNGFLFWGGGSLYKGPLARREPLEYDLIKLARNPDVSVRMRGVMEKCTFCVQRVEGAKIAQKVKAGASPDVRVPDGTIQTACEQVCPADAITFGNLLDPESRVSRLKHDPRNYAVLGFLDVKPRVTYLARIRNPNPQMPDARTFPAALQEYVNDHGSPMETHGPSDTHGAAGHGHESAPAAGAKKGAH
jgi:molybdopterin-containing oxidoreductase family iron-sulfur binding subunit